ncbi:molecular chaperone [Morganella morganii]
MLNIIKYTINSMVLLSASSIAGVSIDSTRIIFQDRNNKSGESVGITSSSTSLTPYRIKAQVLKTPTGESEKTPFIVTPSLFRLEPGTTNKILIIKDNMDLPKDKESVFYLRTIATPTSERNNISQQNNIGGSVKISSGNIIKLFYRPDGLKTTPHQAMKSLQFTIEGNGVKVLNPSPYYVTLNSLSIGGVKVPLSIKTGNTMIPPQSGNFYPNIIQKGKVEWEAINDYGGLEVFYDQIL